MISKKLPKARILGIDIPFLLQTLEVGARLPQKKSAAKILGTNLRVAKDARGRNIPIIDYTYPGFDLSAPTEAQDLATVDLLQQIASLSGRERLALAKETTVITDFLAPSPFVDGLATYLHKAGQGIPLREIAKHPLDLAWLGSSFTREVGRRGKSVSMLEERVMTAFIRGGSTKIKVIGIGGGPASDTWNALLRMRLVSPAAFARLCDESFPIPLDILILDPDSGGFHFGKNVLTDLTAAGQGPLRNLFLRMARKNFNWSDPNTLPSIRVKRGESVMITAEGSLFHYASDRDVVGALSALRDVTPEDTRVVGSAYQSTKTISRVVKEIRSVAPHIEWKLRGKERIRALARKAGWALESLGESNSIYETFILKRQDYVALE